MVLLPVDVNGERQIFAGLEKVQFFLEQEGVRAKVDVLFARDETLHNFFDLRVHQRLAARNGNHWRAAFIYRPETFFRAQFCLQNVCGVLDFAAARAS
jgi:hypothetical protein